MLLRKINLRRFSSSLRMQGIKKPTQVVLERQALGATTESATASPMSSEALDAANMMPQSDSAVLDSRGIFREQEEGVDKMQNYVDPEKAFKSDMQMINYKSTLPYL